MVPSSDFPDTDSTEAGRTRATSRGLREWIGASVANRMALAALLLTSAFVLIIGTLSYLFTRDLVGRQAREDMEAHGERFAAQLENALNTVGRDITGLAANSLVANALVDSQGRSAYLQPFIRDHRLPIPIPAALTLVDFQGNSLASNLKGKTATYFGQPWLAQVIDRSQPHVQVELAVDGARMLLAVPVIYGATGKPEGAMVAEIGLKGLLATHDDHFSLDHGRVVILQQPGGIEIASAGNVTEGSKSEFVRPLHLTPPMQALGLALKLQEDNEAVTVPLRNLALTYSVSGVAALLLALWLARIGARRLLQPLTDLSERADRVSAGDFSSAMPLHSGDDEIGTLTTALNRMLSRLHESHEALEAQVEERTRALSLAQNRLSVVLDNVIDGVIAIDDQGRIELFNRGAEQLFGYPAAEVIGRNVSMLMPEPHRCAHDSYMRQYLDTGVSKIIGVGREVPCLRKDGSEFPGDLAVSEVRVGERRLFVGRIHDLTEQRKIDRMKNEFISTVSHELRTPLTSIHGSLGLLSGSVVGELSPQMQELVGIASRNSERLIAIVSDILDVERIATGKLDLSMQSCDVSDLLVQAIADNEGYGLRYGVRFVLRATPAGARIRVDRMRFVQVVSNLLSNAAKFSPRGAMVEVGAHQAGHALRVYVADRGPGIPVNFREKIFQQFSQADASDAREKGGAGLGLSISRALAEKMGGRIGFEAREGGGTTFFVDFPQLRDSSAA